MSLDALGHEWSMKTSAIMSVKGIKYHSTEHDCAPIAFHRGDIFYGRSFEDPRVASILGYFGNNSLTLRVINAQ